MAFKHLLLASLVTAGLMLAEGESFQPRSSLAGGGCNCGHCSPAGGCDSCGKQDCHGCGGRGAWRRNWLNSWRFFDCFGCRSNNCGCGEIYYGDYASDPPDVCEPCDCFGNWIGHHGHQGGYYRSRYRVPQYSSGIASRGHAGMHGREFGHEYHDSVVQQPTPASGQPIFEETYHEPPRMIAARSTVTVSREPRTRNSGRHSSNSGSYSFSSSPRTGSSYSTTPAQGVWRARGTQPIVRPPHYFR